MARKKKPEKEPPFEEMTTEQKLGHLRRRLEKTQDLQEYKSLRGAIGGLSGSRVKKAAAGKRGGRGRKRIPHPHK